jgi:hypothetical protein
MIVRLPALNNCRINNHNVSAHTLEKEFDENTQTSDRCIFFVICHDCGLKRTEIWTRSNWFLRNACKAINVPVRTLAQLQ